MNFGISSDLLILIAGWKISAANCNICFRFCCSIYQGMKAYSGYAIFYSPSCHLWYTHGRIYIKDGIPWTSFLFTCSNHGGANNWFNHNCNAKLANMLFFFFLFSPFFILGSMYRVYIIVCHILYR